MINLVYGALVVVAAYLLGSIPSGLLFARARGIDIRSVGSGNIGATNVSRALGKKLGAVVLLIDAVKGAVPVGLVLLLGLDRKVDPFLLTLTGSAAIAGHCFSIFLRFHGGKGVATSLGVFLVVAPLPTLCAVAVFAASYAVARVASLGSVLAVMSMPVWLHVFGADDAVLTLAIAVVPLIIVTHRENLARLFRGNEPRV